MQQFVRTETPGYLKDITTGAIINTNDAELQQLMIARQKAKETDIVKRELDKLKSEFSEIKNLLAQVLNGRQNG